LSSILLPKFEDTSLLVEKSKNQQGVKISDVFPIDQWTEAYEAHKFYIRIYAFSEHFEAVEAASRSAIAEILGITSEDFFATAKKLR
jgi:hypothetical protein